MSSLSLQVLGCRGSMAVAGDRYRRYGGNTTCFHVEVEPGHHLVIDCGTGLRSLQHRLDASEAQRFTVLLTHYHWDHIQGLPVFMPLFSRANELTFMGPRVGDRSTEQVLGEVMRPPWWPIALREVEASVRFMELRERIRVGPITVTHTTGRHPQGVAAYRLQSAERALVIATDHETGDVDADRRIVSLASGADVLIHDAQYTPEELRGPRAGWGHSCFDGAVRLARESGVSRLVLTSHDPDRDDEAIDRLRGAARGEFPHTDAAYEGMTIQL